MMRTLSIVWRYGRWVLLLVVVGFMVLVVVRIPVVMQQKDTAAIVAAIHAQRLTLSDVDGSNLPLEPSKDEVDATVAGVDANQNGIRDDVELALFKKYPDNIALRAAALQYAMTEQMYLTKVTNMETWKAVAEESSRANRCVASVLSKGGNIDTDWIDEVVFNSSPERRQALDDAFEFITSHGSPSNAACDVEF